MLKKRKERGQLRDEVNLQEVAEESVKKDRKREQKRAEKKFNIERERENRRKVDQARGPENPQHRQQTGSMFNHPVGGIISESVFQEIRVQFEVTVKEDSKTAVMKAIKRLMEAHELPEAKTSLIPQQISHILEDKCFEQANHKVDEVYKKTIDNIVKNTQYLSCVEGPEHRFNKDLCKMMLVKKNINCQKLTLTHPKFRDNISKLVERLEKIQESRKKKMAAQKKLATVESCESLENPGGNKVISFDDVQIYDHSI